MLSELNVNESLDTSKMQASIENFSNSNVLVKSGFYINL